jgi:hypothetical protein
MSKKSEDREQAAESRQGYYESEDHVPDHTAMMGTLDTTGTGGSGGHSDLENLAPIFRVAKAHDLAYARRAVDPDDPDVSEDLVTLSTGISIVQGDPEGDRQRVTQAADDAEGELNTYGYRGNFDSQQGIVHDRSAQAEQAWASSVSDMSAALVIGGNQVQPIAPQEETPEPEAEDKTNPEVRQEEKQAARSESSEGESAQTPSPEPEEPADGLVNPETTEDPQEPEKTPEEPQEPKQEPTPAEPKSELKTPEGNVKPPNKASSKTEWVDWAQACGADRTKAESMSRLQLITEFGKYRPTEKK